MDRRVLFWGSVALSIAVTALLWALGIPGFFFTLFLPFLFFPASRPRSQGKCGACESVLPPDASFCPRCGAKA